jgi:hypothetical protein
MNNRNAGKKAKLGTTIVNTYLQVTKMEVGNLNIKVRTKAKLNKYNATGFDVRQYRRYKDEEKATHKPIYLYFVDEGTGTVYGNFLSTLDTHYVDTNGVPFPNQKIVPGIILFSCERMPMVCTISESLVKELRGYSERSYKYNIENPDNMGVTLSKWVTKKENKEDGRQRKFF